MAKNAVTRWRWRTADLCFGDFVPGQLHHCKVPLPQGADDLIEAHLQGPSLGRPGLSPLAALCHDHHAAATVRSYSAGTVLRLQPAEADGSVPLYFIVSQHIDCTHMHRSNLRCTSVKTALM